MELTRNDIIENNDSRISNIRVGGEYMARIHGQHKFSCSGNTAPYPDWGEIAVPVRILGDYGMWWLVDVLKHRAAHPMFGDSEPYKVTIDKLDVIMGIFTLEERR